MDYLKIKEESKSISDWIVMADRYPFKAHEIVGIEELTTFTD